jgi:hypothetical protein
MEYKIDGDNSLSNHCPISRVLEIGTNTKRQNIKKMNVS